MDVIYRTVTSLFLSLMSAMGIQPAPATWQMQPMLDGRTVALTFSDHPHSSHSATILVDQFDGLKALMPANGPAKFRLRRDAGVFEFDGVLRLGYGGGTMTFAPSETFPAELAKRGFAKPSRADLYKMAWHDTGFALIDELAAQKYQRPTLQRLIDAGDHGIDRAYVREMTALVKDVRTVDELIRQHDHGINGVYIRDLASLGLKNLSADDLVRAHDHGISREWLSDVISRNRTRLSLDELVSLHDHGVRTLEELRRRTHAS